MLVKGAPGIKDEDGYVNVRSPAVYSLQKSTNTVRRRFLPVVQIRSDIYVNIMRFLISISVNIYWEGTGSTIAS